MLNEYRMKHNNLLLLFISEQIVMTKPPICGRCISPILDIVSNLLSKRSINISMAFLDKSSVECTYIRKRMYC